MVSLVKPNAVRIERRPITGASLTLDLPFPPSTNNLFPNKCGRRVRSKEYEAWITASAWQMKIQRARPVVGPVEVAITLQEQPRRMDLDNRIKALLDLLVSQQVIDRDDNSTVRRIIAQWGEAASGARVEIRPAPDWKQRRGMGAKAAA